VYTQQQLSTSMFFMGFIIYHTVRLFAFGNNWHLNCRTKYNYHHYSLDNLHLIILHIYVPTGWNTITRQMTIKFIWSIFIYRYLHVVRMMTIVDIHNNIMWVDCEMQIFTAHILLSLRASVCVRHFTMVLFAHQIASNNYYFFYFSSWPSYECGAGKLPDTVRGLRVRLCE